MKTPPAAVLACLLVATGLPFAQGAQPERDPLARRPRQSTEQKPTPAPQVSPGSVGTPDTKDYLLQPQDKLRVQVYQEEDINRQGEVTISQECTVFLPLIGTISVKGKTARQAEKIIRDLYDKDYLVNPQVSVTVMTYAERTFNVFGAVGSAGRKTIPPERTLTILDALSMAGGASRIGDLKKVKLTRNKPDGDPETVTINVDEIMKGTASGNRDVILIQPDDAIFVPEKFL